MSEFFVLAEYEMGCSTQDEMGGWAWGADTPTRVGSRLSTPVGVGGDRCGNPKHILIFFIYSFII